MADKKSGDTEHVALVSGAHTAEDPDKEFDEHGLAKLTVSEGQKVEAEPNHKIAEKSDVFDPNAAYRAKLGFGPGLQDSEAKNPAVWVDQDVQASAEAGAAANVARAQRELDRAKALEESVKKGEPLTQEIP
jgi:hypothetical protein